IRFAVHHHPTAASAKSSATSPSRTRTATNAGTRLAPGRRSCAAAITCSGGPGELGRRKPALALVLDPERVDPRARRFRHREVRRDRMGRALDADRLSGLDSEGNDVLDLEVDRVPDAHAVAHAVVLNLDRGPLDTEHLTDQWAQRSHRAAELAAEDADELVGLLGGRTLVDEDSEAPVSLGHDLARIGDSSHPEPAYVRAFDVTFADVEEERDAAVVVCRAAIHRNDAGAHELARARFDVGAFDVPGHQPTSLGYAQDGDFPHRKYARQLTTGGGGMIRARSASASRRVEHDEKNRRDPEQPADRRQRERSSV